MKLRISITSFITLLILFIIFGLTLVMAEGRLADTGSLGHALNIPEAIKEMPLVKAFNKGAIVRLIAQIYKRYQTTETSIMLDAIKDLGFKFSTHSGITIAASDVVVSKNKDAIIEKSNEEIKKVIDDFDITGFGNNNGVFVDNISICTIEC